MSFVFCAYLLPGPPLGADGGLIGAPRAPHIGQNRLPKNLFGHLGLPWGALGARKHFCFGPRGGPEGARGSQSGSQMRPLPTLGDHKNV